MNQRNPANFTKRFTRETRLTFAVIVFAMGIAVLFFWNIVQPDGNVTFDALSIVLFIWIIGALLRWRRNRLSR